MSGKGAKLVRLRDSGPTLEALRERYTEAVLGRDPVGAGAAVEEGLRRGRGAAELMVEVVGAAQRHIGHLWQDGALNVAQEHLATQIALSQLERLSTSLPVRPRLELAAVVGTVEGEEHGVGARIFAALLRADGWEVHYLGESVPVADLLEFVRQARPELVALSVTMDERLPKLQEAVRALGALEAAPRILVGGGALERSPVAGWTPELGTVEADPFQALREARRLAGLTERRRTLEEVLRDLGRRIQRLRKEAAWSQQQLAERSGLDRTYISAAEHGKQNLTLSVVLKLADALGVPIERLLVEDA